MQTLRHALLLTRFVLVWFALSVGVAIASPFVNARGMDFVCSSTGSMKLVMQSSDGNGVDKDGAEKRAPSSHTLDCPLCATISAPPPSALKLAQASSVPTFYVRVPIAVTHIAAQAAPPMPSRGPPLSLL